MKITCPYCGSSDGYYRIGEIRGSGTVCYDSEGNELPDEGELDWDFVFKQSSYHCSNCGKNISHTINNCN